jgi:hypothetical protein
MLRAWLYLALLAPAVVRAAVLPAGVDPRLARQDWILYCQGCHRPDATGSLDTAPALKDFVARFLRVRGGREYLARVPGIASAPLSDAELAGLLNWVLWRFDAAGLPASFRPYDADEMALLRHRPLRTEVREERQRLLREVSNSASAADGGSN